MTRLLFQVMTRGISSLQYIPPRNKTRYLSHQVRFTLVFSFYLFLIIIIFSFRFSFPTKQDTGGPRGTLSGYVVWGSSRLPPRKDFWQLKKAKHITTHGDTEGFFILTVFSLYHAITKAHTLTHGVPFPIGSLVMIDKSHKALMVNDPPLVTMTLS